MVVLTFPVSGFFLGGGEIQISLKCIHNIPTLLGNNTTELGLLSWFDSKESTYNAVTAGDVGSIPGPGRSPGGGHSNPFNYSCLEDKNGQRTEQPGRLQSIGSQSQTGLKRLSMAWQLYLY